MADLNPPAPSPEQRTRIARADIAISPQEHNMFLAVKLVQNRLTGEQVVHIDFEVSLQQIKLFNVYMLSTDVNAVLAKRQD